MVALLSPARAWRMLRHSRGFGVHSPFAYRFITEVLRQPHAYYAYDSLTDDADRIVFRVALDLRPRRVAIMGAPGLVGAVHAAVPNASTTTEHPDLVVADATAKGMRGCLECIRQGAWAIVLGASAADMAAVREALTEGMTFANTRGTIIAANRHLPRQDYELFF